MSLLMYSPTLYLFICAFIVYLILFNHVSKGLVIHAKFITLPFFVFYCFNCLSVYLSMCLVELVFCLTPKQRHVT